jgi:hypothetical protein
MSLSKSAAVALINRLYHAIPHMSEGWGDVRGKLYDMCKESEKGHRRNRPAPKGFSTAAAARYFTVKALYEGYRKPKLFKLEHIDQTRHEYLYAQVWAGRHRKALTGWVKLVEASEWAAVDYPALME